MFSERLYLMMYIASYLAVWFGTLNFSFDPITNTASRLKDPKFLIRYRINSVYVETCFLVACFIEGKNWLGTVSLNGSVINILYCLSVLFFGSVHVMLNFFTENILIVFNGTFGFARYLQRNYLPKVNPEMDKLNWLLDAAVFCQSGACLLVAPLTFLACLYAPRENIFLGSLIPQEYYYAFPMTPLIAFFYGYEASIMMVGVAAISGGALIYLYLLTVILTREFQLGSKRKSYLTTDAFREPQNIRYNFRAFQILNENGLCFMAIFITGFHYFCMIYPVVCNYLLIRHWGDIHDFLKAGIILGYVVMVTFWIFVLQIGKYLWVRQSKTFNSWSKLGWPERSAWERKIMRKFQKSCRPVLLHHAKILVLGRMTQFTFVKSVIALTFKVLILGRK